MYDEVKNEWIRPPECTPSNFASPVVKEIEPLSADVFTESLDLSDITTLSQRFRALSRQPERTIDLYPAHKQLLAKRSKRCRKCQHNLVKPELSPVSIKYKMQLFASYVRARGG